MTYILTDIDDTVLEFSKCFQDWATKRGLDASGDIRQVGCIATVFGLEDDPTVALIEEFFHDPAFAEITPEPCALEVLPRLHREGFKLVAITACANDTKTIEARTRNLEQAFGFRWHAIHCTGMGQSKDPYLQAYKPSVWVEDNFSHAVSGAELGHHAVVIDRPYNREQNHAGVLRLQDWRGIDEAFFKAQIL